MDWFESICNVMHFNNNDNIGTYQEHLNFSKSIQFCPISTHTVLVRKKGHYCTDKNVPRLVEKHFPERIPLTEKRPGQQRCVVCYKSNRRKETVFWCPECEAAHVLKNVSMHST
jgi:hypothetical protein